MRLSFELTISDPRTLWEVAALRAAGFAMTEAEIAETIGDREDPDWDGCAMMLLEPLISGTCLSDLPVITITELPTHRDNVVDMPAPAAARL